jgi:hypothetical protein
MVWEVSREQMSCFAQSIAVACPAGTSFSPTRVRVQHDTFIRASRAAIWSLMQVRSWLLI